MYYRFLKKHRFNWRKLLLLSAVMLIAKIDPLHRRGEQRLLIIDDTVEPKRGKQIEGGCRYLWSNKEHRLISSLNNVSLNYADSHSTFQLDFALRLNTSRHKKLADFSQSLHHRSNAFKRCKEGLRDKNLLALEILEHALYAGIVADYLLIDSWYAKPDFIHQANAMSLPVIARIANTNRLWHFKSKYKSLQALYIIIKTTTVNITVPIERFTTVIAEHQLLGRVKLLFLHTGKELIIFISADHRFQAKR
nr:transposase [Nitratifractor salsuginis]